MEFKKGSELTRQSTSDEEMLYLLGLCLWVFNANCHLVIELIDKEHNNKSCVPWIKLIELSAGQLQDHKKLILKILGNAIYSLFVELVDERNAIVHSIPSGETYDNYVIPTYRKDSKNKNIKINKDYLRDFIKKNEELNLVLLGLRGY